MNLISVDPSLTCTGWAIFKDSRLFYAGYIKTKSIHSLMQRVNTICSEIFCKFDEMYHYVGAPGDALDALVIEWPQIYKMQGKGQDPNGLLPLAAIAGALVTSFSDVPTTLYKPREWKGTVPKNIHNERVYNSLSEAEKELIPTLKTVRGDVLDAVGVGLYHLAHS